MDRGVITEHAGLFVPAFAVVELVANQWVTCPALNLEVSPEAHPRVPAEEMVHARYGGVVQAVGLISDAGRPPAAGKDTSFGIQLFFAAGSSIVVTGERLAGVAFAGETLLGNVDESHGQVLAWSYPWSAVTSVDLDYKRRFFGGVKEIGVGVASVGEDMAKVSIDPLGPLNEHFVSPDNRRGTPREFMTHLVAAACDWRLSQPAMPGTERERLLQVRGGAWTDEGDSFCAWLVPPED